MKIKKILLDFVMNCYRALFTSTNFSLSYKNRLDFDAEILRKLRKQQSLKSQVPLISAVIRVKNGEEYIEASILSILPLVSEVVIIDNGSKDNTLLIVKRLKKELQNKININVFSYDKKIEIAGEGYSQRVSNNPDGSLADFYNYSFSLARCEYLMKWDAHAIMFEHAVDKIQSLLKNSPDAILFRGLEFYGKNLNQEIRIYRNDIGIEYSDSEFYEKITFTNKKFNELKTKKLITPAYLHLKRLSYNKMIDENHENIISKKYE